MNKSVIVSAKRTPIGSFNGVLSKLSATKLGSIVIKSIIEELKFPTSQVNEVIMGNILSAGLGQAPARQAALYAGLQDEVECLTINKVCGSGLKSVMLADQAIRCGDAEVVIAGGMESMSNAPYLLPKARNGYRLGHGELLDSMIKDGLWEVYNDFHMGSCAEACARDFQFSREEVDEFSINSYKKAMAAKEKGLFKDEICNVLIKDRKGEFNIDEDEEIEKVKFDKIPILRPAFEKDGIVTAANSSKINDGASALLIMSEQKANALGFTPLVEIVAQSTAARKPIEFTIAPADSIRKVLNKAKLTVDDIDLFEINEAFAVVSLAVTKLLDLDDTKVNVNGGAIALGHPIGASGARILTTLIHEMKRSNKELGLASLCLGGGEATSVIVKNYK